jgi:ankyrin repeat protein
MKKTQLLFFTLLITTITLYAADTQQLLFTLTTNSNPEEILERLKLENFDINTPIDHYEKTVLHHACGHLNCISLAEALILHNANINVQSSINGETPLHEAASIGNLDIVELLLNHGANPKIKNHTDATPLDIAEIHGHDEVAKCLRSWSDDLPDVKGAIIEE